MKKILLLSAIISLTQIACKKSNTCDPASTSLEGKWKMIIVKDNSTGLTAYKPSSIQKDVVITFTATNPINGTFTGNTPTNEIGQNAYLIGINQGISIPGLSMTKVAETTWGSEFVDNIRSSTQYSFDTEGRLNIQTANKTLTFQKQ